MKLILAGGCGEHGRNCFLLEGADGNLMVDCGVMAGSDEPMPHLTTEQIRATRYVLLTHSHKDHTGAAGWLLEQGFDGTFMMTAETARQLPFSLPKARLLATPEKPDTLRLGNAKVEYGMSGHCAGAVWYRIHWEDRRVFFSGDYNFFSDVYEHHVVSDRKAEAAVLDSCYPEDKWSHESFMQAVQAALDTSDHLLLPVPKYGRGLDLLLLLARCFPTAEVVPDSHLLSELSHLKAMRRWLRPDAYDELRHWKQVRGLSDRHVLLLSDPQLSSSVGRMVATLYLQEHHAILFSGSLDQGSLAETLVNQGKATCHILPVHNSDEEYEIMKRANRFKICIPYHTARKKYGSVLEL